MNCLTSPAWHRVLVGWFPLASLDMCWWFTPLNSRCNHKNQPMELERWWPGEMSVSLVESITSSFYFRFVHPSSGHVSSSETNQPLPRFQHPGSLTFAALVNWLVVERPNNHFSTSKQPVLLLKTEMFFHGSCLPHLPADCSSSAAKSRIFTYGHAVAVRKVPTSLFEVHKNWYTCVGQLWPYDT